MSDRDIVAGLIDRNPEITYDFLYVECYRMFEWVFCNYYTDCVKVPELISNVYAALLYPVPDTGKCSLEMFEFKCSLKGWVKVVLLNMAYCAYRRRLPVAPGTRDLDCAGLTCDDRFDLTVRNMAEHDIDALLSRLGNASYRRLLRLRYIEGYDNCEVAERLHVSMGNYYNMHHRAKKLFCEILEKEGLI